VSPFRLVRIFRFAAPPCFTAPRSKRTLLSCRPSRPLHSPCINASTFFPNSSMHAPPHTQGAPRVSFPLSPTFAVVIFLPLLLLFFFFFYPPFRLLFLFVDFPFWMIPPPHPPFLIRPLPYFRIIGIFPYWSFVVSCLFSFHGLFFKPFFFTSLFPPFFPVVKAVS